jgi:hypothetical protein
MSASASATSQASRPTAQEILPLLRAHHHIWAERFHLRRIGLFGSVVRGEATVSSDVDVWVDLSRDQSLRGLISLRQELEDLLGCPVDVSEADSLHPLIRSEILQQAREL